MTKINQIIYAANSFSIGILAPVLTLILLERGASLRTLPLLLAIYSFTVLCLELPSGIFADIYGRKAAFMLSCGFQLLSFTLFIIAHNLIYLIPASFFMGLGRAFSSGSLDALIIDQALETHGEACLSKVTSRLAILEGVGLASGSVTGGALANISGIYTGNLALRLVFAAVLLLLCLFYIKEQPGSLKHREKSNSLLEIVRQGKQVVLSAPKLMLIIIGVFFTGFFLSSIEAYWQPAFVKTAVSQNDTWMLGFITFAGYFGVILGSMAVQNVFKRTVISQWSTYNFLRIATAAGIIIFSLQKSIATFVSWYAMIYVLLGAGNVAESTLVNKYTPNQMRASMLSLSSLSAQIGGLCASLFSSAMVLRLGFQGIWAVSGGLAGVYAIALAVAALYKKQVSVPRNLPENRWQ